jgi:hypothetical protein
MLWADNFNYVRKSPHIGFWKVFRSFSIAWYIFDYWESDYFRLGDAEMYLDTLQIAKMIEQVEWNTNSRCNQCWGWIDCKPSLQAWGKAVKEL